MRLLKFGMVVVSACTMPLNKPAYAQPYPTKPIRVVVPNPPGGATDIIARLIGPRLTERLGQQIVIENRPGASGVLGLEILKNATPDGYTIGQGQGSTLVVAPHTFKKLPYDPLKDFTPIALNVTNYAAVVATLKAPFTNAREMIAWAKANPGKLSVATNGEGAFPHLAFERLGILSGFKFLHVPYKGPSQLVNDVIGGQVQVGIGSYTALSPFSQSGRVRLIAITNPVRAPNKPDLPIFADVLPGYDMRGWFGFIAPAAVPRNIIMKLNEEINRAVRLPDVAEKLTAAGLDIATESPSYFAELIKSDYAKYGKLIREIGLQPQ